MSVTTELQAEKYVLAEQVRLIYRMLPYGLLGALLSLVVLAIALWDVVPETTLITWLTFR